MRLVMKSGDAYCNIAADVVEKVEDVVYAYNHTPNGNLAFVGMFSLGSVDFLYLTGYKHENG